MTRDAMAFFWVFSPQYHEHMSNVLVFPHISDESLLILM